MRSKQNQPDDPRYSDLQVLRSNAGYYVGTLYNPADAPGTLIPGSRDSYDYFMYEDDARMALFLMEQGKLPTRDHP